jgi:hypothetical protein
MPFALTLHALAERHTPESEFSHLNMYQRGELATQDQSNALLCHLTTQALSRGDWERSPAPACILVNVPADSASHSFRSPIVTMDAARIMGATFHTEMHTRQPGEEPTLKSVAHVCDPVTPVHMYKSPAGCVQVVLYTHDESPLGDRNPMTLQWQLVSINAHKKRTPDPQHPTSMARNQKGLVGGSEATYTPEQWADSVWFWSTHIHIKPVPATEARKAA